MFYYVFSFAIIIQEIDPVEKTEGLINSVTKAINELCQCGFSQQTFYDIDTTAGFQCFDESPTTVTFRGELGAALTANSTQLVSYIEQWIATSPTIVVQRSRLSVDSTCDVAIDDFSDPECSDVSSPADDESGDVGAIAGGVLGGIFALVIIAVVLVIVVLFVKNRYRRALYEFDKENLYE